jgi:GT2 family glycosyltransferase
VLFCPSWTRGGIDFSVLTMPEQGKVDIIILNYKGADDTLSLLRNLSEIEYSNYRVILVENGSADNSADRLKAVEQKYPDWKFIYNEKNLGFAGGCNQAIRIAMAEGAGYVLLLNNDTEVMRNFLTPLVDLSKKHDAITGGVIYYHPDGVEKIWSFGGKLTFGAVPGHLSSLNKQLKPEDLPIDKITDWIPGCCMLIPAKVIVTVGLFDEDYFAYVEDVDYCIRANKEGFKTYVTSKSVIYHKVGQSTGGGYSVAGRKLIAESGVIFMRKHGTLTTKAKFLALFFSGLCVAFVREGLKGNAKAVFAKFRGFRSGMSKKLTQPGRIS